jgi:hypothetical protein
MANQKNLRENSGMSLFRADSEMNYREQRINCKYLQLVTGESSREIIAKSL